MKQYLKNLKLLEKNHVYSKKMEHDACGVGLVASIDGKKSRKVIEYGIEALKAVWHRGAVDADGKTGDGAGIPLGQGDGIVSCLFRSYGDERFIRSQPTDRVQRQLTIALDAEVAVSGKVGISEHDESPPCFTPALNGHSQRHGTDAIDVLVQGDGAFALSGRQHAHICLCPTLLARHHELDAFQVRAGRTICLEPHRARQLKQ